MLGREQELQRQGIRVAKAGFGEQRPGATRIVRVGLLRGIAVRDRCDRRGVGQGVAVEDLLDDRVPVDGQVQRQPHALVDEETVLAARVELVLRAAVEVEPARELLRARGHLEPRVLPERRRVERRHALDEPDLARSQRGDAGGALGDRLESHRAKERLRAPVRVVLFEQHRRLALPFHHLPWSGPDRAIVQPLHAVLERVGLGHHRLAADEIPERRRGLAGMDANGVVVHLLPSRDERVRLLERGRGQHVLDRPAVEVPSEEAIEIEEHGVGVERLTVVEGHAAPEREFPGELPRGLPRERQARHRATLGVHVDQALEHLTDVVRANRAHADARVHVGGVVSERDHQLGVGIDGDAVHGARLRGGLRPSRHQGPREHHRGHQHPSATDHLRLLSQNGPQLHSKAPVLSTPRASRDHQQQRENAALVR